MNPYELWPLALFLNFYVWGDLFLRVCSRRDKGTGRPSRLRDIAAFLAITIAFAWLGLAVVYAYI